MRHGIDSREKGKFNRMYATPDNPDLCPMNSLTKYLSKLNPKCTSLFQRVKTIENNIFEDAPVWYVNKLVGHNKLGFIRVDISTASKLSQRYTNHCVRATWCTILDQSRLSSSNIMTVSGHRNEIFFAVIHSGYIYRSETKKEQYTSKWGHRHFQSIHSITQK